MPISLTPGATVSAQDRSDVIDLVNRLNMAFDVWDLDTMLGLLTDDFTVHHPKGVATGHDQMVAFYKAYYPLTVGVRRQHPVGAALDDDHLASIDFLMSPRPRGRDWKNAVGIAMHHQRGHLELRKVVAEVGEPAGWAIDHCLR